MKQKNMILVAVAVACGLVAAVLTSQISAGNKTKSEETVPVLVAAKDLPVGTWLKKDTINEYVEVKDFPVTSAPAAFVANPDDLADKRVVRTMRKGDSFNPKDISKSTAIAPPDGYGMMSIPCTLDETVTGFVQPGSKVNILASIPSKRNGDKATVITFLHDMLVLAVDGSSTILPDAPVSATVGTVSFAVTSSTAELLHAAKTRGCLMRLVLVGQTPIKSAEPPLTEKQLWALLADVPLNDGPGSGDGAAKTAKKEDTVKLVVAREDVPAGTKLTDEAINTLFEMKEFAKPAPANGVENVREFAGKFVTKDLASGQFLPKTFVGGDPKAAPKAAPADGSTNKEAGEVAEKKTPELPPVYHDVVIQTGSGVRKLRYQVLPNGEFKNLGEVSFDVNPDKVTPPEGPEGKAEPKTEPKAAPKAAPKTGDPAKAGERV